MIVSARQTCPVCWQPFIGGDVRGIPCPNCQKRENERIKIAWRRIKLSIDLRQAVMKVFMEGTLTPKMIHDCIGMSDSVLSMRLLADPNFSLTDANQLIEIFRKRITLEGDEDRGWQVHIGPLEAHHAV